MEAQPASQPEARNYAADQRPGHYFIALLPSSDLTEEVRALQQEFADRFHASRALRLPPHLTLQPPFFLVPGRLEAFTGRLAAYFGARQPLALELDGFGSFSHPRQPVIFIQPRPHAGLLALYLGLAGLMREAGEAGLVPRSQPVRDWHPHLTLAYRDLKPAAFGAAWAEFRHRAFRRRMEVSSAWLLTREKERWVPRRDFPFHN
ncbi:MAG TPA: 2'-5' RNA ligase family protein [Chitinophagaceae bacterium]|nr:2'-5' RNA ligase family protein [Chitinophagaceae bacterium]